MPGLFCSSKLHGRLRNGNIGIKMEGSGCGRGGEKTEEHRTWNWDVGVLYGSVLVARVRI